MCRKMRVSSSVSLVLMVKVGKATIVFPHSVWIEWPGCFDNCFVDRRDTDNLGS